MKILLKSTLVLTLLLFTILSVNAQSLIVKGGLNLSNMTIKDKNLSYDKDNEFNIGYHAGLTFEMPLAAGVSIEPGLLFTTKGFKSGKYTSLNMNYLDIPINLKYNLEISNFNLWLSAGPYVGVGLFGKYKAKVGDVESSTKIEFGDGILEYKRLDYGVGVGAGVEFSSILIGAYYNLGLANVSNVDVNDYKSSHSVISISLGYRIGE